MHSDEPMLIDVPESLRTERLDLRAPCAGDGVEINQAIVASVDRLKPWMEFVHPVPTVEQTEKWCREARVRFLTRESLVMQFRLRDSGVCIGTAGLHRIDWKVRKFEIGFWVRTGFEGKGFVTEVAGALEKLAFETLGARRVEVRMHERNDRSRRVAERLGFELEGILRKDSLTVDGKPRDTRVYAKVS
jgi:RimJ/RimL family protein N-acetyltransferase